MMSDFKAKYHALHIMQRLASGERSCNQERRSSESPRKPGIRSSEDILREKYAELAELMAVQHMEQRAVSALQKMYLSPRKEEKRPSKTRKRKDGGRVERSRKRDNYSENERKRPQSASSNSSFSSYTSAKSSSSRTSVSSNSSGVSHASRTSSHSHSSRSSSKSNSSRSSTRSNSSRASSGSNSSRSSTRGSSASAKPVSRHFVTIVEEEEEEEVVNQEKIQERQVVRFDEELAKENEEEARLKKDASKRTRRVSFVLEAEEQSSDEEDVEGNSDSDDTLTNDERVVPGQEADKNVDIQSGRYDHVDGTRDGRTSGVNKGRSQYIEIQNSILREILSPRSPRRMVKRSPRSGERSPPRRSGSKSPVRSRRSTSPKRAWELFDELPPRPKRDVSPCDHKLSNVDNPTIRKWLRHKNALIRRQKKAELRKEREEREAAEARSQKVTERHTEAEQLYDTWLKEKRQSIRKQQKMDRITAREKKKREEEEKAKQHEMIKEKQRRNREAEKLPSSTSDKKRRRKAKSVDKKSSTFDTGDQNVANGQNGKRNFPSSNPFKGLTYDEWMKQKLEQEQSKKKETKSAVNTDPELEDVIPRIAKERIQRAAGRKGKRVDSGLRKDSSDLPDSEQPSGNLKQPKPYTWKDSDKANSKSALPQKDSGNQEDVPRRAGLQRPSTAQNRLSGGPRGRETRSKSTSSPKTQSTQNHPPHRVFSPTSARPEPYGSESNDDHSEAGAKLGSFKNNPKPSGAHGNNNSHNDNSVSKTLVKREGRESQNRDIILDPGDLSVFMTEAC